MGLETGTNIGDLVVTNPAATDVKSQGDDHLRLIKSAVRQSFAGFSGAVLITGTNAGAVNAYTVTPTTALLAYGPSMLLVFSPSVTNTGPATVNVSGLGVRNVKSTTGDALLAGELEASALYLAVYTGTEFHLIGTTKQYADQLAFGSNLPAQAGNAGKFPETDGTVVSWVDLRSELESFSAGMSIVLGRRR
jgi:hypothetical protein